MYNSTSTPKPMGDCPRCGYMTYLYCHHDCPTAPKIDYTKFVSNGGQVFNGSLYPTKKTVFGKIRYD